MAEWTIDITSAPSALDQVDVDQAVEQVAIGLEASPSALGPAVSANTATGTISATYQVEAESDADAMHIAHELFTQALLFAGVNPSIGAYEQRPADPGSA
jgi:hypothetical protein